MDNRTDYIKIEKNARMRKKTVSVITYILLVLWAVIVLFPFYWMILTSVKSYSAYNSEYIPNFLHYRPPLRTMRTLSRRFLSGDIF